MFNSRKTSRATHWNVLTCVLMALVGGSLFAPTCNGATASAAETAKADLVVNFVNTPTTGAAGEAFSYEVSLRNLGPSAADSSQIRFDLGEGVTEGTVICKEAQSGAECPVDLSNMEATITKLPAQSNIIFTVSGKFPWQHLSYPDCDC